MGGSKVQHAFELNEDQMEWLERMTSKHDLPDEGKALRIVLDFVMNECDDEDLFTEIRCHHC